MTDPNLKDFYGRVARIERAHAHGFGHEAHGTLGRAAHIRRKRKGLPLLRASLFLVATLVGMKATVYAGLGPDTYLSRLAQLKQGTAIERAGAVLMAPDPLTGWLSAAVGQIVEG